MKARRMEIILWLDRKNGLGLPELAFAHTEEQRQRERDAHEYEGDHRQPAASDMNTGAFSSDENHERRGRNENVYAEKSADAVGEELVKE